MKKFLNKIYQFVYQSRKFRKYKKLNNVFVSSIHIKKIFFRVVGKNNSINFSNISLLNTKINIEGSNNNIIIKKGTVLNGCTIWIKGNNNSLIIGEQCTFKADHFSIGGATTITIGNSLLCSSNVVFYSFDSHSIIKNNVLKNKPQDIIIGNHVWICYSCKILKGTHIGDDSVVAINSMVNKEFGKNLLIGGLPAKILDSNIVWNR